MISSIMSIFILYWVLAQMSTKKRDPRVSRISVKVADYRERIGYSATASVFATVAVLTLAAVARGFFLTT
jgi:hypothetical protein